MNNALIRYATTVDIDDCQRIARQHADMLPFVRRDSLQRGVDKRELFVAECDGLVIGFCSWHARKDGWSKVYDLAVERKSQGYGVGRMLLHAAPCPVTLKCTVDNPANAFYLSAGFRQVGTEKGLHRDLNVYQMRVLNVIVRGGKFDVPEIARKSGSAYGIHHSSEAHAWPFMVDSDPEHCDWPAVMKVVGIYHPVQALTADYFPGQREAMLSQVDDLRQAGVLRIAVCPKFHGAVADIPADCVVAVSLKTNGKLTAGANKYAGFMPDLSELRFRRVHLLGGSPRLQKEMLVKLQAVGAQVLSVDGNSQFGAAAKGSAWIAGRWQRKIGEDVNLYETQILSTINIQRELNASAEWKQESYL